MSSFNKEAILGAANTVRGMINKYTLVIAFVLSMMVINNYRQCRAPKGRDGSGYIKKSMGVRLSYYIAITILIAAGILLSYDAFKLFKK
jgi:hypothetical protein